MQAGSLCTTFKPHSGGGVGLFVKGFVSDPNGWKGQVEKTGVVKASPSGVRSRCFSSLHLVEDRTCSRRSTNHVSHTWRVRITPGDASHGCDTVQVGMQLVSVDGQDVADKLFDNVIAVLQETASVAKQLGFRAVSGVNGMLGEVSKPTHTYARPHIPALFPPPWHICARHKTARLCHVMVSLRDCVPSYPVLGPIR